MNTRYYRFLLAVVPLVLVACKGEEKEVDQVKSVDTSSVEVVATKIVGVPYEDWGIYSADLRGAEDAVLVTSAGGTLKSVSEVGSRVAAGQALCNIDSDRYKAQLDAAKAGMDAAQAAMDVARRNVEAGSLGKAALDGAAAQFYGAQSQYLGAKTQYQDSRCQAPFAGVIASRLVNRWQAIGPGTPTLRIVRNDRLEASFAVPEAEAHEVRAGMDAAFYLLENPGKLYHGKVSTVDLAADARNRVVVARVIVANSQGRLRPGLAGKVRILHGKFDAAVVVPSSSLLRREDGVFAVTVLDGKAHEVPVVLGSGSGDSVQVLSGLAVGDRLIVQGAFRVSEGTKVRD